MNNILKKINLKIFLFTRKSLLHKTIFLILIYLILFIPYFLVLNNYNNDNNDHKKIIIENIEKQYEKNIHISKFEVFYSKNKDNIIKIIQPEVDYWNFFQIIIYNNDLKKLETYKIFKTGEEKWENFWNNYETYISLIKEKWWVWLYFDNAKINIWQILGLFFQLLFIWFFLFIFLKTTWIWTKIWITLFTPNDWNRISFNDIWWIESNKKEIEDIIKSLKNWKSFKKRWIRSLRWILFYWPPWTWKTMLAKAIASEIWSEIFIASWNDFWSKYINEGAEKVKKSFKKIENFILKHKKDFAILFIDEIDSILKQRWGSNLHSEDDKVVNSFLDRIDWIEWSKNIIIIWATNYINKLY